MNDKTVTTNKEVSHFDVNYLYEIGDKLRSTGIDTTNIISVETINTELFRIWYWYFGEA